ncbi:MAG TPA: hypothetical protein PKA41_00220 [Verrucomicrobiota bacterium]|nr:hypothetical protein [Verrucomicrobiota bacterium]
MNLFLPKPLREALEKGVGFFMGEDCEWKFEQKESAEFIEKIVGCPVYAFANNGFGDYLFLKKRPDGDGFGEDVFEFFHEGPEIKRITENLETLLGLKDRPASVDVYPKAIYETGELVQVGDRVQVKVWAEFWKGWQDGQVDYVPGISKKKLKHEYNGLKWVAIRFRNGEICPVVDPKSGKLRKVRFVARHS